MLQVYNSSLFRSSSWFAVEKSRSHRHGRNRFIVYPFFTLITNQTSKTTFVRSRIMSIFQHDNKLIAPKVAQQWSLWNGMTDQSWLSSISRQHVAILFGLPRVMSAWPLSKMTKAQKEQTETSAPEIYRNNQIAGVLNWTSLIQYTICPEWHDMITKLAWLLYSSVTVWIQPLLEIRSRLTYTRRKRVMMHNATIANFTLGRQQMQNAYLFEMLNL